jgi:hypothetical protein
MSTALKDWPYSAASKILARSFDWQQTTPETLTAASREMWIRVPREDLNKLKARYPHLYDPLRKDIKEVISALIEGRPINLTPKKKGKSEKDNLLAEVEAVQEISLSENKMADVLKALQMKAQIHSLLNVKPEVTDTSLAQKMIMARERIRNVN